ncbi:MAG: hypothetical protein V4591_00675 [Bdellovibrionota bacterium]
MQIKKTDDKPPLNSFPINPHGSSSVPPIQGSHDSSRKKIILYGLGAGILGAIVAGGLLWRSGFHLNLKVSEKPTYPIEANKAVPIAENPVVREQLREKPREEILPTPPQIPPQISPHVEERHAVVEQVPVVEENFPQEEQEPRVVQSVKTNTPLRELYYDETPAVYQYSAMDSGPIILVPAGAKIEISRDIRFKNKYLRGIASQSGEFRITNPPPGSIYWRIKGENEIHRITVESPQSTNITTDIPNKLNLDGSFSWKANENASFYKIEISNDASFSTVVKTFSTKENSMGAALIGAGMWFVRVSALNLSSGTFDYSQVLPLTISNP